MNQLTMSTDFFISESELIINELLSGLTIIKNDMGIYLIFAFILASIFLIFTLYTLLVKMTIGRK